ncbi:PREDICTED: uncharacterized protein LOC109593807 [Amphimedon queenslandica]|nr:PREDICTED: uncharacterized protein LOC109593807 [Amphimedon queenslandica]|eukprot:XP_019864463.1 PREDICTED: uncharacterized protein LOC109593807 [Amphimedon queenslandica]
MSTLFLALLAVSSLSHCLSVPAAPPQPSAPRDVISLTFLVCVNDTWGNCITTVKTPPIKPNTPWNKSENIMVGDCDHGPLLYTVQQNKGGADVVVTFYSSVIEDASHPECTISWDFNYLVPKPGDQSSSLLPGCFVADSREGYHMTYYWFYIIDWFTG